MGAVRAGLLVVIPALNEEETIESVVAAVRQCVPEADVLVVDDGSTDCTRRVASAAGAKVLSLPFNLGVGGALRTGFRYAERFGYSRVVQVDADGQHPADAVPQLLAALDDADIVIGARFAGEGDYTARGPRRLAMRVLARSLSRRTRAPLTDTTSGFRAFNRRAIDLFARDYPAEYLGDTIEALAIAGRNGCRISQVPVRMRPRAGGTPSSGPLKSTLYLGRVFLALGMSRLRR